VIFRVSTDCNVRAKRTEVKTNLCTTTQRCIVVDCSYSVLKMCRTGLGCIKNGNHCSVFSVIKYL